MLSSSSLLIKSYNTSSITLTDGRHIVGNFCLSHSGLLYELPKVVDLYNVQSLNFLEQITEAKDLLLVGCGSKLILPSFEVRRYIAQRGFKLEWMTTDNAIATANLLLEDFRNFLILVIRNDSDKILK